MAKNKQGNEVEHGFNGHPGRDRYWYDFGDGLPGFRGDWIQYDTHQDASYFGVWVNPKTLQTFTYCEGDTTLVTCPDKEHLRSELDAMAAFYGDPPPAFKVVHEDGSVTLVYDERPAV